MPRRATQPCGSYGGAQRHRRNGEELCPACDAAEKAYRADYRATRITPLQMAAYRKRMRARGRALTRLARLHPAQFQELYRRELAQLSAAERRAS